MAIINRQNSSSKETGVSREVTIQNRLGLHARPAAMFVKICSRFSCDVWVEKDGEEVNGKSIMGLMMLAAGHGSKLRLNCKGQDAAEAVAEIERLIDSKFNEE